MLLGDEVGFLCILVWVVTPSLEVNGTHNDPKEVSHFPSPIV